MAAMLAEEAAVALGTISVAIMSDVVEDPDENKDIGRAIRSVYGLADEIVVIDTGDGSVKRYCDSLQSDVVRCEVVPWVDFGTTRNESLRRCTMDWILVLDSDEVIPEEDHAQVRLAAAREEDAVFFAITSPVTRGPNRGTCVAPQPRLFRRTAGIRYRNEVHNEPVNIGSGWVSPIRVVHHGYDLTPELWKKKTAKRIPLLREAIRTDPTNPWKHYNLMRQLRAAQEWDEALEHAEEGLRLARENPDDFGCLLMCLYHAGALWADKRRNLARAFERWREAIAIAPEYADPLFAYANSLIQIGEWDKVESLSYKLLYAVALESPHLPVGIEQQHLNKGSYAEAWLGKIARDRGDEGRMKAHLARSLNLDPEGPAARILNLHHKEDRETAGG